MGGVASDGEAWSRPDDDRAARLQEVRTTDAADHESTKGPVRRAGAARHFMRVRRGQQQRLCAPGPDSSAHQVTIWRPAAGLMVAAALTTSGVVFAVISALTTSGVVFAMISAKTTPEV